MKKYLLAVIALLTVIATHAQKNVQDEFVKMLNGNWELTTRVADGKVADTEGSIFFNLTKSDNSFFGEQLATESGILDAFVSGGGNNKPYEIASLFKVTLSTKENTINFNASGEIMGDYGPFTKGIPSFQNYAFVYSKGAFTLRSQQQSMPGGKPQPAEVKQETQVYDKVVLTKDKLVMYSSILKTVDTYKRVSTKGGRVGGIFTLSKFYEMFKDKMKAGK